MRAIQATEVPTINLGDRGPVLRKMFTDMPFNRYDALQKQIDDLHVTVSSLRTEAKADVDRVVWWVISTLTVSVGTLLVTLLHLAH